MSEDATLDEFANSGKTGTNQEVPPPTELTGVTDDWANVRLAKVAKSDDGAFVDGPFGSNLKADEMHTEGYARVIQLQNIRESEFVDTNHRYISEEKFEELSRHGAEAGDLAIAKMSEPVARACLLPDIEDQYLVVADCIKLSVDESAHNSQFVMLALNSRSVWKQAFARSRGSTRKRINLTQLKEVQIPSPPLSEQRKIATVLHTVDQAIQKTEEIVEQTHTIKKSLMQDIFHGYHKDFTDYHTTPVGEIPIDWSVASIGDVVHTAQYGISESMSEEGQYPIFRMNNIENGYMIDEPLKYIDLDDDDFEKYRVEEGDILFNRTNSLKLVGKTGIYQLDGDHVFASYLVRLQTNDRAEPYYLNYYMNSSEAQNRMMDFATKGVSQANINANSIQQVKIPLPPIEEQKEIVGHIRSIDSQIESNRRHLSQLKRIKNGLMQDLLSGKVRTTDADIDIPEEVAKYG
jgi:type I restriction enzyme S subunit